MPPGCLVDVNGLETLDPDPMANKREGALSAFGSHKGSGLGIFVELLAGALVSDSTVATMEHLPHGVINNMFSVIIDPAAFDDPESIARRTMEFYDFIKTREPAVGTDEVLMPGEPELITRQVRHHHGVPVDSETIRQILETAGSFSQNARALQSLLVEQR